MIMTIDKELTAVQLKWDLWTAEADKTFSKLRNDSSVMREALVDLLKWGEHVDGQMRVAGDKDPKEFAKARAALKATEPQ